MRLSKTTFITVPILSAGALSLGVASATAEPINEISNENEDIETTTVEETVEEDTVVEETEIGTEGEEEAAEESVLSEAPFEQREQNVTATTNVADQVVIGEWTEIVTTGFGSNEVIEITLLDSDGNGVTLGETSTNAEGSFSTQVLIPHNSTPGEKFIVLIGTESGENVSVPVTVVRTEVSEEQEVEPNPNPNPGNNESENASDESESPSSGTDGNSSNQESGNNSTGSSDSSSNQSSNFSSSSDEAGSDEYWTEERMSEAEPIPMPTDGSSVDNRGDRESSSGSPTRFTLDGNDGEGEDVIISAGYIFGGDPLSAAGLMGMSMGVLLVGGGAYALHKKNENKAAVFSPYTKK